MKNKGFTLLELLLVVTLLLIIFGVVGLSFSSNIKQNLHLSYRINSQINGLSIYNQLAKQIFSGYTQRKINIKLEKDRLSFYTYYPLFFSGAVRAEYYIEEKDGKKLLVYEEFPYVDGKLGYGGLKRQVLGTFKNLSFEALKNNRFYTSYSDKDFPQVIKLVLNENQYLIFSGR